MRELTTWLIAGFILFLGCRPVSQPNLTTKETKVDLGDGVNMEFVWIEELKCWVGKYPVTNEQYRKFRPDHNSGDFQRHSLGGIRQPVVRVSYDDAAAFVVWVNQTAALPPGFRAHLPDGKEWITYAQCGDGRKYPWGNKMPPKYGNYSDETYKRSFPDLVVVDGYDDGCDVSCPVEESGKNDWGLYGVGGNVSELTTELYDNEHEWRVVRGGSWDSHAPVALECAYRDRRLDPSNRFLDHGFRLLLGMKTGTPPPPTVFPASPPP